MLHVSFKDSLKQRDALLPLLFNFAIEYTIRRVCTNQDGWKLNGAHQFVVYADDMIMSRRILLKMTNVSDKRCREKTHFVLNNFFPNIVLFMR